ncbi:MAG: hypothetical protein H7Z74_01770 [Anaerolineae bacterium]|nr:hypothetical protein [Gemmatimonadaceae bacterium]
MDQKSNDTFGSNAESEAGSSGTTGTGYGSSAAGMSTGVTPGANFGHAGGVEGTRSTSAPGEEMFGGTSDTGSDFSRKAETPLGLSKERMSDRFATAKDKAVDRAGELKTTLADKLESGAGKLRQRSNVTPAYAGASGEGSTSAASGTHELARVGEKVAGGMEMSADWLRNNDLNSMKESVEKEVKANPGRSLLFAAVAGYLLGKAFRR